MPSSALISTTTLILGDEPELVYRALEDLTSKVEDQFGPGIEKVSFQGGECSIQDVVSSISQIFMFSPRALIVVRDPSEMTSEDAEVLLAGLESYEGENFVVLANFTGSVDAKLKSFFASRHSLVECSLRGKGQKTQFLGEMVQNSGLRLDPEAYRVLAQRLGEDVARVMPTLDLLKAALGDNALVDVGTLEDYLPAAGDVAPWDLTDAIESGNTDDALEMLWRFMSAGGRHPLVVLAILQRRFVEFAVVSGSGIRSPGQAHAALKERDKRYSRKEFVAKKTLASARVLGYSRIAQAFVWMSQADRQIKGEGGFSPELAIELLVARLVKSFSGRIG